MTETRAERIARVEEETRREAQRLRCELMTTAAVAMLVGVTQQAVTDAVRRGKVDAPYRVSATIGGRETTLIKLDSALEHWARRLPDNAPDVIEQMRANCHIMGIGRIAYNILHPEPLVRISDADA